MPRASGSGIKIQHEKGLKSSFNQEEKKPLKDFEHNKFEAKKISYGFHLLEIKLILL